MIARRLLALFALLAALAMPIGHSEASAHGPAAAMAGHCHGSPSTPGKPDRAAIDCVIACAVIAPEGVATAEPPAVAPAHPEQAPVPSMTGIQSDADPPPPRVA